MFGQSHTWAAVDRLAVREKDDAGFCEGRFDGPQCRRLRISVSALDVVEARGRDTGFISQFRLRYAKQGAAGAYLFRCDHGGNIQLD
jgi:hypothetical protein